MGHYTRGEMSLLFLHHFLADIFHLVVSAGIRFLIKR
jgi:hypothetical protein